LFSREEVAAVVNRDFEAAWESVRPVPVVRIDFGNGHVVTRTLHGNIATHVCAADGQLVDILPGIYTPAVYVAALDPMGRLAASLPQVDGPRQDRLRDYHRERARLLRSRPERIVYPRATVVQRAQPGNARAPRADRGKGVIERRTEQIVVQAPAGARSPRPRPGQDLAEWQALAADTWLNETERRLLIHERLAAGAVRPEQIKRWLYRDVLHADLDDPYLGLGDTVLGDDIFRETDA
jgi:hypothetical protein